LALPAQGFADVWTGLVDGRLGNQVRAHQQSHFLKGYPTTGHDPAGNSAWHQMFDAAPVQGQFFAPKSEIPL
jgi:hypothetical protein